MTLNIFEKIFSKTKVVVVLYIYPRKQIEKKKSSKTTWKVLKEICVKIHSFKALKILAKIFLNIQNNCLEGPMSTNPRFQAPKVLQGS